MSARKKQNPSHEAVLGVSIGPDMIHAALLKRKDGKVTVVARFLRQRVAQSQMAGLEGVAAGLPGMKQSGDSDYVLEFGDGADDTLGGLEIEALKKGIGKKQEQVASGAAVISGPPIASQLREILQECTTLGHPHPVVTFCLAPPNVAHVQLDVPEGAASDRKQLLELLKKERAGSSTDRVVFVPLRPQGAQAKSLAVVAEAVEPVAPAMKLIREEHASLAPSATFVDAEVPLFDAMVRHGLKPLEGERTALVRVGNEDTAVFFWEGQQLVATERLRSVSAYDQPDVVCSRVLLQQDVLRVGELSSIIVMSSGRQDALMEAFRKRFPSAAVESAHAVLGDLDVVLDAEADVYKAGVTSAALSALRYVQQWDVTPETNLLPPKLQKVRRTSQTFAWHNLIGVVLLIGVSVYAYMQHQTRSETIEQLRIEMRENPPPQPLMNPAILQARVDSLAMVHQNYTRALNVLDGLLVGTDRWITTMERLSVATASVPRTWLDSKEPRGDTSVRITGRSLSRLAVVDLSRRLDGAIQMLNYDQVGQQRVYSFEMIVPTPVELPRAAMYLRSEKPDAQPSGPMEVHPAGLPQ